MRVFLFRNGHRSSEERSASIVGWRRQGQRWQAAATSSGLAPFEIASVSTLRWRTGWRICQQAWLLEDRLLWERTWKSAPSKSRSSYIWHQVEKIYKRYRSEKYCWKRNLFYLKKLKLMRFIVKIIWCLTVQSEDVAVNNNVLIIEKKKKIIGNQKD